MSNETNEFRDWLKTAMKDAGIDNQTALAAASALGQTVVSSYLSGARKPERRDQVERLVRALLPPGGGQLDAQHLLKEGLRAAGLTSASTALPESASSVAGGRAGVIERMPLEKEHDVIVYLRGKPQAVQEKALRILKAVFEE
ncbi:MAG: hypothetical protein ACRYFS_05775 [Janthinobacterium lividum]